MADVRIGDSIKRDVPLWRYMSLDKFIDVIDRNQLFFTPLSGYDNSDPFEGYMPRACLVALSDVLMSKLKEQRHSLSERQRLLGQSSMLSELDSRLEALPNELKEKMKNIMKSVVVNCWHANLSESEAMWRLYSDEGKGIAIKTSVASLIKSIESCKQNVLVQAGAVKYLDFHDSGISPSDCVVDGHIVPLLKRKSFSHENEVRLFIVPDLCELDVDGSRPKPRFVKINALDLIEAVYISPFATEPFASAVISVCEKYSVPSQRVSKSNLLDGHEELLDGLFDW